MHHQQVFVHREVPEDLASLGHITHAQARNAVRRGAGHVLAEEFDLALARRRQPHDRAHRRGLARAIAAQQRDEFAFAHGHRHAFENMAFVVVGMNVVEFENGGHKRRVLWRCRLGSGRSGRLTQISRLHPCVVGNFIGRALGEQRTVVEHGDAIGDAEHDFHVMLHEQGGDALVFVQITDQRGHVVRLFISHPGGGLVEQQQLGTAGQRNAHLDHPLVAVRHLARHPIRLAADLHQMHQLIHLIVDAFTQGAPHPGTQVHALRHLNGNTQVFIHRERAEDLGDLESADDAALDQLTRVDRLDGPAIKGDLPFTRREKPADQVEQRGLARAVGSNDRAQLSGLHLDGNVSQRLECAKAARDVVQLQQAHDVFPLRCKNPITPSGKNSTDSTKIRPMTDIQLSVTELA